MPILDEEAVAKFRKDGYYVIPDFFSREDSQEMLDRAKKLIEEMDLTNHPMTTFSTSEQGKHVGDDYFLSSNDKISFFLEPSSISRSSVDSKPELTVPKTQSVNKIGHALCQLDPVFKKFTLENERIKDVARGLGEHEDPLVLQSMIICKQPKIGAKVPIHTDSTFLYTHPATAVGFWIALEDVTETNGALSFLPGSHVDPRGGVGKRFVRMKSRAEGGEGGTGFIDWDEENGKERAEGEAGKDEVDWEKEPGWELATCKAGSLVLIHGNVQHQSPHNLSDKTRFIYTFHMIEGAKGTVYDERNWLQPAPALPFARLLT
ncbi:hypothetical protein HD553DRAFT_285110 [Filobasidium floriforme]|uniref:uncharacterized protein n=1 Tax=Filobasidium floriforme TaxID=5210 RepID=UPI001E8EE4AC|nr:uncharacterized protein HD553DRAFT_285110 [Filobasidium floriforme]KAH8084207.1 hypothetical protein HD553DRAFT_285110 [Filobasidium floriforme]